ncbi:MAG TPA: DinB family protein [Ktedonobacterales bacterium]|nr:DinB family protein [Ktedonobacterales bacterium]
MSNDWQALQQQFAAAFDNLLEACEQIDPALHEQQVVDGQWSPKALVAHLTGWEHEATERFWRFLAGPTENITYDNDSFNSRSIAARQHLTWNQTIRELKTARQSFLEAIAAVTPDDLAHEPRFSEWLANITEHYAEHTMQLQNIK